MPRGGGSGGRGGGGGGGGRGGGARAGGGRVGSAGGRGWRGGGSNWAGRGWNRRGVGGCWGSSCGSGWGLGGYDGYWPSSSYYYDGLYSPYLYGSPAYVQTEPTTIVVEKEKESPATPPPVASLSTPSSTLMWIGIALLVILVIMGLLYLSKRPKTVVVMPRS